MGFGLGIRGKASKVRNEATYLWLNTFRRPLLNHLRTMERIGVIYDEPSDMCVPDKLMLYALVRGLRPERVLEIGVRWGAGARIISAALEDAGGRARAVGIDPEPEAFRAKSKQLFRAL
jgi:predicted O-methyltransferase YrrM